MDESPASDLESELAALRAGAVLAARGAPPRVGLEAAAEQITTALRADFLEILHLDQRDRTVVFAIWSARDARIIDLDRWLLDDDQLVREVVRTRKAVRRDSIPRPASADSLSSKHSFAITSSVGVPIVLDNTVWGAMFVHSTGDAPLTANTEERLSHFDASMSAVVKNSLRSAEVEHIIAEQAALLRVAELVARENAAEDLFSAVAEQLGLLARVSGAQVFRFDDDEMVTSVGSWGPVDSGIQVGRQLSSRGNSVTGQVRATGLPARVEDYSAVEGRFGTLQRDVGMRCAVGAPIRVAGRLWGVLVVGSIKKDPLPLETEERMARFADLVGVALSNLEARSELQILAAEQEALRRVATVVAREDWDIILPTIARELALLHHVEGAVVIRYEDEEIATVLAAWGRPDLDQFVGRRLSFRGDNPGDYVWRTLQPARQHDFEGGAGVFAELSVQLGIRESLAGPVFVENRLWGAIVVLTTGSDRLPTGLEARIGQFAELIATAIGNMKSRLELIESRARIVHTADQTRRRFERDLHDGIQQRLVTLTMDLRAVEEQLATDSEMRARVSDIANKLVAAIDGLRELSRGIHPAILSEGGLVPATRSLARRSPVPVTLHLPPPARYPDSVEVAAYYVMSEALANTAKYAQASTVEITIAPSDGALIVTVADDGIGGADPAKGSGLAGLDDRVKALGGSLTVNSPLQGGTTITTSLPLKFM